jgi:tetratricopeptide (TPR) repeat protein
MTTDVTTITLDPATLAQFESSLPSLEAIERERINAQAKRYVKAGDFRAAIALLEGALTTLGEEAGIYCDLAFCWRHLNEPETSIECYGKAVGLGFKNLPEAERPEAMAILFANYSTALVDMGDIAAAGRACVQSMQLLPNPLATWNFCCAALIDGQYEPGWRLFKTRYDVPGYNVGIDYGVPVWEGAPCERLLLVGEQGIGERIMFASLFDEAAERSGGELVVELVDGVAKLKPLFERSFPKVRFAQTGSPLNIEGLNQALIGDLAPIFRPSFTAFPERARKPWLVPDPVRTAQIREQLSPGPVIGLSWRSSNREFGKFKSCSLEDLAPILAIPGARFVSLQYGDAAAVAAEIADAKQAFGVTIEQLPIDLFNDVDGAAALVAACDHVVTVSNINAHLAGALGVPASVMLGARFGRVWYFGLRGGETPWYPSLQIFRRDGREPWGPMIGRVAEYLGGLEWAGTTKVMRL